MLIKVYISHSVQGVNLPAIATNIDGL